MKLLLVSHNAFSDNNANGRVLSSVFSGICEHNIAQLYIQTEVPTTNFNSKFFRITDKERLKGFFKGSTGCIVKPEPSEKQTSYKENERNLIKNGWLRTSSIGALLRNFIWSRGKFDYTNLYDWIFDFKPDLIVFQSGRTPFLCRLVQNISEKFNLPVILFSTEDEYFHEKKIFNFLYNWHLSILRKSYRQLSKSVICQILIQDELKQMYEEEFKKPSYTVMMGSSLSVEQQQDNTSTIKRYTYAGNLDRGRHKQIIEIADYLGNISNGLLKLTVIPSGVSKSILSRLKRNKNIVLKTYLPFEKYMLELRQSDVLFFVDSFSKKYKTIIKETFTGKTADYLATGKIIFVYSPEYVYTNKYFKSYPNTAIVASNKKELYLFLRDLIEGKIPLNIIRKNCKELFLANHDSKTNALKFKNIVEEALINYEKNSSN